MRYMPFSMRLSPEALQRLEALARRRGQSKSRVAETLIDEGIRMEDHPGIVFRDGPTGRRAALARGPDVWEVVGGMRGSEKRGEEAIAATAEWLALSIPEVRIAVRYYAAFQDEIDARIRLNDEEAERGYAEWLREREALA
jgi:hypothetical protein